MVRYNTKRVRERESDVMRPLIFVIDGTATATATAATLLTRGSAMEEEEEEESRTAAAAAAPTNSLYKQIVLTLQNKHPVPITANAKSPRRPQRWSAANTPNAAPSLRLDSNSIHHHDNESMAGVT